MRYTRLISAATLLAAVLGVPHAVSAAVSYRITLDPAEPRVGESATIVVGTFDYVDPPSSPVEPLPLDEFPWTFVADSPTGRRHELALQRLGSSANQWTARFTFDEVGQWEVGLHPRHLATPVDPALGARTTVTVRAIDGQLMPFLAIALAAAALLVSIGLVGRWRSRR